MPPRTEAQKTPNPSGVIDAARQSASADASARRVQELERTLAAERAQGAARAKEVGGAVLSLRKMLQDLHGETKQARDENRRLSGELDASRRALADLTAAARAPAPAPVPDPRVGELETALAALRVEAATARDALASAKSELASSRSEAEKNRSETDAARERIRALESDVAARSEELKRAFERIAELTAALDAARKLAAEAASQARSAPLSLVAARKEAERKEAERAPPAHDASFPFPEIAGLRIERRSDHGLTGTVYEAREVDSRRAVLVRVLPGALKNLDGKGLDSLLLARHPNLVSVLSFAGCSDGPYLVTEREDGETATHWIRRVGPLPERIAMSVIVEVARALRQAASHGALHGDLGPDSVLIEISGRVRVRGVGLRAVFAQHNDAPRAPTFASPERLRGSPPIDARSDIYSLGALLQFLLTGKAPYEGDRETILRQQSANAPIDLRASRKNVSDGAAKLVRRLLASDPDLRSQSWDEAVAEIARFVPNHSSATLAGRVEERPQGFFRSHPWVLGAAIAGIVVGAGIIHVMISRDPSAAERFRAAIVAADTLAAAGDNAGARSVYRRFLSGTGDPAVEREAARRFDALDPSAPR